MWMAMSVLSSMASQRVEIIQEDIYSSHIQILSVCPFFINIIYLLKNLIMCGNQRPVPYYRGNFSLRDN